MATIGVIVIGRNEGERLIRCLKSVLARSVPVVYVDSGSTDGSVEAARSVGAEVVELDTSIPFTAARARNAGFDRLVESCGQLDYVQFIDGDCELFPNWLDTARHTLDMQLNIAAVCGRLRECFPNASIYNRLCDFEWNVPPGIVKSCGGIAMYRASAFLDAGRFDPTIPAGEEPELCMRLRRKGHAILRLADEMAWHDSALMRFGQWWKRQTRGGYGGLDIVTRFEQPGDPIFAPQIARSRRWGIGYPVAVLLAGILGAAVGGKWIGLVCGFGAAAVLPLQILRLARRAQRDGVDLRFALVHATLTMVAKWAQLLGQFRYVRDRRAGRHARLIEYKTVTPPQVLNEPVL
jgi:glycosyltransferase involved in cell wall biosynthesis